ncbi:hypothetical protein HmCmsJML150_04113 [Escherichia coli]|nr:hypothetical protein HmCmsJML150_04113 [Escherichia coli]
MQLNPDFHKTPVPHQTFYSIAVSGYQKLHKPVI